MAKAVSKSFLEQEGSKLGLEKEDGADSIFSNHLSFASPRQRHLLPASRKKKEAQKKLLSHCGHMVGEGQALTPVHPHFLCIQLKDQDYLNPANRA